MSQNTDWGLLEVSKVKLLSIYVQDKAKILVCGSLCGLVFAQNISTVRQILPYL